jgi:nickel transport system substrate-binding protein
MTKIAKLFLAMSAVAFFFAVICSVDSNAQTYDPADTLIYSFTSNVGPLNPHMYSPNQMFGQNMVYDALVVMGHDGKIKPSLAERWEISPDGLTYTFYLRKDLKFSDGTPLDAEAIYKNFKMIMDNKPRHVWMGVVGLIDKFEAVEPLVFRLTLSAPYYPTLEDLAVTRPFRFLSPSAFPDKGLTADGIKAAIGSGPWILKESVLGEYDLFERNELYWGEKPQYSTILIKIIVDPVARGIAFETGEIDLIYGMGQVNYDVYERFTKIRGVTAKTSGPMGTFVMAMNTGRFPTDQKAVREAIDFLTDRDAVAKGVTLGSMRPAFHLLFPGLPYCDVGLAPYSYDPKRAAAILDEAGWTIPAGKRIREKDGVPLNVDYCFDGSKADQKAAAEIVQAQAIRVGVNMNLVGEEEDSYITRQRNGEFGLIMNPTWGPPSEPHSFMSSMRVIAHSDYLAQAGLKEKPEIDKEIGEALSSVDETERQAHYKRALTLIHDEYVYLPLYYEAMMAIYRDDRFESVEFGTDRWIIPFETFKLKKK